MLMKRNLLDFGLMRVLVIGLMLCFSIFSASAQSSARIDASGVTTLKQLIQKVEAGSSYRFSWSDNLPNDISISVPNGPRTVEELLSAALTNKGVTYVIQQNDIVLLPQQKSAAPVATAAKQVKEPTITGTIVDAETGLPVIGASIWIKNTTVGTTADMNGNFTIKSPSNLAVMAVSFIGYEDYEVAVNTITSHTTIKLATSTTVVEDVVVHRRRRASSVQSHLLLSTIFALL